MPGSEINDEIAIDCDRKRTM